MLFEKLIFKKLGRWYIAKIPSPSILNYVCMQIIYVTYIGVSGSYVKKVGTNFRAMFACDKDTLHMRMTHASAYTGDSMGRQLAYPIGKLCGVRSRFDHHQPRSLYVNFENNHAKCVQAHGRGGCAQ